MYFLNVHHVGHFKILISVCHTMLKLQFLSKNKFWIFGQKMEFHNSVLCITELKSREEMFFAKNALNVYMKCI